jgi:hypothetical protein
MDKRLLCFALFLSFQISACDVPSEIKNSDEITITDEEDDVGGDASLADADVDVDVDEDTAVDDADAEANADTDLDGDADTNSGTESGNEENGNNDTDSDTNDDSESSDDDDDLSIIQKAVVNISSYNYFEKKMTFGVYDAYQISDSGFRVVCEQPCAIPEIILKKKVLGAKNAIDSLVTLTGGDVVEKNQPVDIHLTSSAECGDYSEILAANGYVNRFFGIRLNKETYMCLWTFDDSDVVLELNEENALKIEAQQTLIHEYAHILFYGRTSVDQEYFEDFVKALSFYLAGFWDGNGKDAENFPKITDACSEKLSFMAKDVYELCTMCGFSFADFAELLQKMDEEAASGGKVKIGELKLIFDAMVGKDSATECGLEWLVSK